MKFVSRILYVKWRELLCRKLHAGYFKHRAYYKLNVLDDKYDNMWVECPCYILIAEMGELDGKVFSLSGPSSEVHAISKNYIQTVCFLWPNLTQCRGKRILYTESMATILMRRRWRWIGHVTRQEASIAKTAMHWTPEGKRKRGRPKITWRRTVEKEIKEMGKTWEGIKFMARDRQMWREHVAALHAC